MEVSSSDVNKVFEVADAAVDGDLVSGLRVIKNVKDTNQAESIKHYRLEKKKRRKKIYFF